MNEWLPKAIVNQDGISLFFFINLLVLLRLHLTTPRGLIGPFKKLILKSTPILESNIAFFDFFHIGSFIVVTSSLSLWFLTFSEHIYPKVSFELIDLYYLLVVLFIFLVIRALVVRFVLKKLNLWKAKRNYFYMTLKIHFYCSFLILVVLAFNYYGFQDFLFFSVTSGCVVLLWFVFQVRFVIEYLNSHRREIFYIIFYLCTLKLAPWLWMYKQLF
mgnify:FL=1|tara:strand:+ start:2601 stop:3248 length:648 start_codon:yes stop_codon:yes gene_type:complete